MQHVSHFVGTGLKCSSGKKSSGQTVEAAGGSITHKATNLPSILHPWLTRFDLESFEKTGQYDMEFVLRISDEEHRVAVPKLGKTLADSTSSKCSTGQKLIKKLLAIYHSESK